MKLIELRNKLFSELTIFDHSNGLKYEQVFCFGPLFESLGNKKVIGIRADLNRRNKPVLLVSIDEEEC